MSSIIIHILLLFIDFTDHCQTLLLYIRKLPTFLKITINVAKISSYILQGLTDRLTNQFASTFFAFSKCQIVSSGILSISVWLHFTVFIAYRIEHLLKTLPCFIQEVNILWKCDILQCTCGIKHQRSLVCRRIRFFLLFASVISALTHLAIIIMVFIRAIEIDDHFIDFNKDLRS